MSKKVMKKEIELHEVERVTIACALAMFMNSLTSTDAFEDENKILAPLAGLLAVGRIVQELELDEYMKQFLDE